MLGPGGNSSGDGCGHRMDRLHAAKHPAIPTGTIGHVTRRINSDTPALSGCTAPVCVRSPSGNISTAHPRPKASSTAWMPSLPMFRSIGMALSPRISGASPGCANRLLRARYDR